MHWMDVNGISLRYECSGAGAQTLVLLHELGGSLDSWDDTVGALGRRFRVLRYDQRGFGHSEKVRGAIALEDMLADLAALLDALGVQAPVHLAGTALGAGIALAFAARHPQRVARVVATSPVIGGSTVSAQTLEGARLGIETLGMRPHAESSLSRSYPPHLRRSAERFAEYRARWICNDPESFAGIDRMLATMDVSPRLPDIRCPVLVIGTPHDALLPPDKARAIAQAIPAARYVELDTGHFMAVQTPELFVEHALAFLAA